MSVMTSSITTQTAAASPSSVIVVKVVPCRYSTKAAMVSDTGSTIAPIRAGRHEPNMASSNAISSMKPISATQPAFRSAASTKLAGRYP